MAIINQTQVTIETVVPSLQIGEIQISADRRSSKEKQLTDAERIRRVVLPSNTWGEIAGNLNGERSQGLTDLLREALKKLAGEKLKDKLEETPELRIIELQEFSVSELLKWSNETAASRGSITFTRDEVTSWFATSATRAAMATKHASNPKLASILAMLETRFGALAAKNHGLKEEQDAIKLQSIIAPEDLEGEKAALVADIVTRLDNIAKQLAAKANEAQISMDDI